MLEREFLSGAGINGGVMAKIICEVGSNFTSFCEAKDAISAAKACGADAVKFQLYSLRALTGFGATYLNMPIDWLPKLKEKADAVGIEFMCSVFSPALYDIVDPYVTTHKIASSELTYPQLLQHVAAKKKHILLSTGGSSLGDIRQALNFLSGCQVTLLYCVSAYPSEEFNLFMIDDLRQKLNLSVGFSDHSTSLYGALSAAKHFACPVIEKHVNFTNHTETADAPHSISGEQFKRLCDMIHGKVDWTSYAPQQEERDMFLRYNRRLIAIKDIRTGDAFRFGDNFGAYRSLKDDARGMSGFAWEHVAKSNGAKHDIAAGDGIGPEDF